MGSKKKMLRYLENRTKLQNADNLVLMYLSHVRNGKMDTSRAKSGLHHCSPREEDKAGDIFDAIQSGYVCDIIKLITYIMLQELDACSLATGLQGSHYGHD